MKRLRIIVLTAFVALLPLLCLNAAPEFSINGSTLTAVELNGATSIAIPSGVTSIGDNVFIHQTSLVRVTIPDGVTIIGHNAFYDCTHLSDVNIPYGVTSIGDWAFKDCRSLMGITIPSSVTRIGGNAFSGCGFTYTGGYGYGNYAGEYGSKCRWTISYGELTDVELNGETNITIPDNVTRIRDGVFQGCWGIERVTIPGSVMNIGNNAFADCRNLTDITIRGGALLIGDYAFDRCDALTNITVGAGVTCIDDSGFSGCRGLTRVTIADSVTTIGNNAFFDCSELTSVTIPDSVTSIGEIAFYNCSGLTNVIFLGNAPMIGSSAFSSVKSGCVASVSPRSTGWDVGEGEKWNGLTLQYWPEVLTAVASNEEAGEIVAIFADKGVAAHVSSVAEYDAFRAWANGNNLYQPTVVDSKNTWLSYALGADALIGKEITSNDVQIVGFDAVDGGTMGTPTSFAFEVAIDGVNIGGGSVAEAVLKENLKKVLGIEGAKSLSSGAFSSDNIDITFDTPVDGKAKFTVSPPADAGNSFFMRVKVK